MKFIGQLLGAHLARYPEMQLADIYKLLHQAALGPAHAIESGDAIARLREEAASLVPSASADPVCDVISPDGRLARVHVRPYLAIGRDLDALATAFARTACEYAGSEDKLAKFCGCLGDLADAGGIPFIRANVETYMNARRDEGWPAVHHSDPYLAAYGPAYRVIDISLLTDLPR